MFDGQPQIELNLQQQQAMLRLHEEVRRMNRALCDLVDSGVTVEFSRSARHHDGQGSWGDLMKPVVVRHRL
jgi:hypothetical protein